MIINQANINSLFTGYNAAFKGGLSNPDTEVYFPQLATQVPSTSSQEIYPWLGQFPKLREWIGDRQLKNMSAGGYVIENRDFEGSVVVPRNAIADDQYGIYTPMFQEMGYAARVHPDELIFSLIAAGNTTVCYDGKNYFDTTHPVGFGTVSNYGGGSGNMWCLLDTRRALKPFIFQKRQDYNLMMMNDNNDEAIFMRKEIRFGVDARVNVGFGFWQQAYGSKATLDSAGFNTAVAAMMSFQSDEGRPLGIRPNLLVCGPSNRAAALNVVKADTIPSTAGTASQTNINRDAVDVLIVPWLP